MNMHFNFDAPPFYPNALLLVQSRRRTASGKTIRRAAASAIEAVTALCALACVHLTRRHYKHALHALDDRMLADIGLARCDIEAAVNAAVPHRPRRRVR